MIFDPLAIVLSLGIAVKVAFLGAKFNEEKWGKHRHRMFFLVVAIACMATASFFLSLGYSVAQYPLLLSILVWMMLDRHFLRP